MAAFRRCRATCWIATAMDDSSLKRSWTRLPNNGGRCGMPAGFFRTADRNGDGSLTPAELQTDIRRPDILYSERMRLTLGR